MRTATGMITTVLFAVALIGAGCNWTSTGKGAAAGAGVGGVVGGIIGKQVGNTAAGAIIGAAIGGTAGAAIGNYMDRQARELRNELKNAEVERVGEGIKITFDSGILFDVDSDNLRPASKDNLRNMAGTLRDYEKTNILVVGHTDSTGPAGYNQKLSEDRAQSVEQYLALQGVRGARITIVGKGETEPVADNATSRGRQLNRRVEVAIFANEKLREAAKEGRLSVR